MSKQICLVFSIKSQKGLSFNLGAGVFLLVLTRVKGMTHDFWPLVLDREPDLKLLPGLTCQQSGSLGLRTVYMQDERLGK